MIDDDWGVFVICASCNVSKGDTKRKKYMNHRMVEEIKQTEGSVKITTKIKNSELNVPAYLFVS